MQRKPKPPVLLGEPSPSLAKILDMNMAKLEAKITSLESEQAQLEARIARLDKVDPKPNEKIEGLQDLLARLVALREAATERLAGKAERKAARERGERV